MDNHNNLIEFPQMEQMTCPECGRTNITTTTEADTFRYGDGPKSVELTVQVPVRTCGDCGFKYTDDAAEELRHDALCRHLKVMPPKKVAAIRKSFELSRIDFARLTRIGEASLARWEAGALIQNAAYDNFLYLLTFSENLNRLKIRKTGDPATPRLDPHSTSSRQNHRWAGLREAPEKTMADADGFDLRLKRA